MIDREDFEDSSIIGEYREAIPRPNTAYRVRLRTQLLAEPSQGRRPSRTWWPWGAAGSALVAIAVALALLVVPFGPRQGAPLNPKTVLARAVSASTHPIPYRGSSVTSFVLPPDGSPNRAALDLGTNRVVTTWAVRDATHWRVDIHVLQPALSSEREVAVANGTSVVWYQDLTHRAIRYSLIPSHTAHAPGQAVPDRNLIGASILSMFQGARGVPPLAQTLQQYLRELNNKQAHHHARLIGQATILGRTADIIELWPVVTSSSSTGPCSNAKQCAQQSKETGYGRARIWIDHAHGFPLRYQEYGLPANSPFQFARSYVYRVTSLAVGGGPSASELAYSPPVRAITGAVNGGESHGFGTAGPSQLWHVPSGFIVAGPPTDSHGHHYILTLTGQSQEFSQTVNSIDGVFLQTLPPGFPGASTLSNPPRGPFLYVEEQRRSIGLPGQLTHGATRPAGRCTVYTGTYQDGLHWLAFSKGSISLLGVSDRLTEQDLVRWAATKVCG